MNEIKKLTVLFSTCVVGLVICLGMTIFTSVKQAKQKAVLESQPVPMPAVGQ